MVSIEELKAEAALVATVVCEETSRSGRRVLTLATDGNVRLGAWIATSKGPGSPWVRRFRSEEEARDQLRIWWADAPKATRPVGRAAG